MKIIDLLNKIANGEEVPKKIKYKTHYWEYKEERKDYKDKEDDYVFSCSKYDIPDMLNNEVEILEEKKIPEKLKETSNIGDFTITYPSNKELMEKINEIIDYLKSKGDE